MAYSMPKEQALYKFYHSADRDGNGNINDLELQKVLSNGTWEPFDIKVVRMMIGMFDRDNSNTIDYEEFKQLWKYLNEWLNCFHRFDSDNSGSIRKIELNQALNSFGYRFSDKFYDFIIKKFAREDGAIIFDNFLHLCITLQGATMAFANYDKSRKGIAKISYEDLLISLFPLV